MNSRAQVTLFMIVGLVILGVVGMLFALTNSLKTQEFISDKPQDDSARFDSATKIIRDCITVSAQRALILIAKQGGALYDDQGGPDFSSIAVQATLDDAKTFYVAKGISRKSVSDEMQNPTQTFIEPGLRRELSILDPTNLDEERLTLGGSVDLPKLCDSVGPNRPDSDAVKVTCKGSAYGFNRKTIQNKLATAIQREVIACAQNSTTLFAQIGDQISTYFGTPPRVIYGDNDVSVDFTFDTNVSIRQSNFSINSTTVIVPVRFKRLYQFLRAVLEEDSLKIQFDKTTDYALNQNCNLGSDNSCWTEGFTLSMVYGAFVDDANRHYDLVNVTDSKSVIGGKPFSFYTVVENRRPVLASMYDVFSFPDPAVSSYTAVTFDWTMNYDVYAKIGSKVHIRPYAYDFDEEDDLQYTYSGWKATTDSAFRMGDSATQREGCIWVSRENDLTMKCSYWDSSYLSTKATPAQNLWQIAPSSYVVPSDECGGTLSRCASYQTVSDEAVGESDLGPHSVVVTVTDRGGLTDASSVAVLVGTD